MQNFNPLTQRRELAQVGSSLLAHGYSVIPIGNDKRPLLKSLPRLFDANGQPVLRDWTDPKTGEIRSFHARGWIDFQTRRATDREFKQWMSDGAQLALVCGAVSGGLLVVDFDMFDGKTKNLYSEWVEACEARGLNIRSLPTQQTGSGGWQVAVRCDQPGENTKLAWVPDSSEPRGRKVAIETRAEGGYVVVAPSLHPNGNLYRQAIGSFHETPHWPQADVDALLDIARSFNRVTDEARAYVPRECGTQLSGQSVIDRYNEAFDIRAVLALHGYTEAYAGRMHRPGHDRTSQPSVVIVDNRSFHHSSNDDLSDGYWHTPFSARCELDFGGDVQTAVKQLAIELGMGYGTAEPIMRAGVAFCPEHPHRELRAGQKSGFYCSEKIDSGFCSFWWTGNGYEQPKRPYRSSGRELYETMMNKYAR